MTEEAAPVVSKRSRRTLLLAAAGGATVVVGAVAIVLGPAGPSIAASLADGAPVWRLGKLHIEGVAGAGLGDLKVKRATLSDEEGVWAYAEDLTLAWKPLRLLVGDVVLTDATARHLVILRRPMLSPPKEPSPVRIDTDVGAIHVERIDIADGVSGPASAFEFDGGVIAKKETLTTLRLELKRLDKPLDDLRVDYRKGEKVALDARIEGRPGGMFANFLEAPDSVLHLEAHARGDEKTGSGTLNATLGAREAANGALSWTELSWTGQAQAYLDAVPLADELADRFGPLISLQAGGEAPRPAGAPFHATLSARDLLLEARGRLDDEAHTIGAIALALDARRANVILPEAGFDAGGLRFDGALEIEEKRTRLQGRAALVNATRNGFTFSAEGPVDAQMRDRQVDFQVDLAADKVAAPAPFLAAAFAKVKLNVVGRYDRTERTVAFQRMAITGPNIALTGEGGVKDGVAGFDGHWRLPRLNALVSDLSGNAFGEWRLGEAKGKAREKPLLALSVTGEARHLKGAEPIGQLLGASPKLEAMLLFGNGVTTISRATVSGRALRAGAQGAIRGSVTDIRLEASAHGPARIAGATLTGIADITGHVTGPMDKLRIQAETRLDTFELAGLKFSQTVLVFDLAPDRAGRSGLVTLDGQLSGLPAKASAHLAMRENALIFDDLIAEAGQLKATGRAAFDKSGPDAQLVLSGALDGLVPQVSGAITGALDISARDGETQLALDASLQRARFGEAIQADAMTLSVNGPLDSMSTRFAMKGWATDQAFSLQGTGPAAFDDKGFHLSLTATGDFAGQPIATRGPLALDMGDGATHAEGALTLGQGSADFSWRAQETTLVASAKFTDAPLDLLTAMLEQPAAGTITGEIKLSGQKDDLDGEADFKLEGARLARRSRDAVDAQISAKLGGGLLRGRIDAKSRAGLVATVDGEVPVIAAAAPFRLEPTPGGEGHARWGVQGPVAGLWALFGPLDQNLSGDLAGAGQARFGKNVLSGEGRITLVNGAFEDKLSGVKLRQIESSLTFDDNGVRLDAFNATDGKGGRITGTGRLNGREDGRLDLELTNMRLLDREDAKALGGGKLALEWRKEGMTLSGDLKLSEAEIKVVESGVEPIAHIDVIEINRPGPPPRVVQRQASIPAKLEVNITAPGRVFTRTRGLDAEWSMDVRLRSELSDPRLYGEAHMIRGDFSLAGRRFELERGDVRFTGPLDGAEVDIQATAETPDLTVHVLITGPALDPQIALTSDPALPEDEILPQLLFGRSARELSAVEAAQLAASLAALAGQSAFDIAGAARAAVDLDRLEFRQEDGGILVAGGKYLTRDVYLEVARDALGQAATSVEWQVRPRLYIISSFGADGDQRLAVRWRRDY